MSHTNDRIYSEVVNGEKIGISPDDVSFVLGVASYDVGYLCSNDHGATNKWARYKPVCHSNLDSVKGVTEKGYLSDYGITPPAVYGSVKEFVANINNAASAWKYQPPTGGQYPYRITDFDGYNHKARNPFGSLPDLGTIYQTQAGFTIPCLAPMPDDTALSLSDFASGEFAFKNWYFGIILKSGNTYIWRTSEFTLSQMGAYNVTFNQKASGVWEIYPILVNGKNTDGNEPANLKIVGIEDSGFMITIMDDGVYISIRSWYSGNILKCEVYFKNETTTTKQISGVLYGSTTSGGASSVTIQTEISLSLASGADATRTYDMTRASKDIKFVQFLGTPSSTGWIGVMESNPGSFV